MTAEFENCEVLYGRVVTNDDEELEKLHAKRPTQRRLPNELEQLRCGIVPPAYFAEPIFSVTTYYSLLHH